MKYTLLLAIGASAIKLRPGDFENTQMHFAAGVSDDEIEDMNH